MIPKVCKLNCFYLKLLIVLLKRKTHLTGHSKPFLGKLIKNGPGFTVGLALNISLSMKQYCFFP